MSLATGTRLGPYEVLALLGAGGMGEVYRAHDTRLDRDVAVKVLRRSSVAESGRLDRLLREARAISRLNHPHICALHDVGQQDGTTFLVMELLEGKTLAEELAKGGLPVNRAIAFGLQIAEALDAAHSRGVTHRDLKPGNVMVTRDGVKLLDFGVAKLRDLDGSLENADSTLGIGPTEEGAILGTYPYMSPEQVQGRPADARSDIFALGVVLYEMASGRRPFEADNRAALTAAILTQTPPPVSAVRAAPILLDRVLARCLEKDPDARWQNARDLASALRWTMEGESRPSEAAIGAVAAGLSTRRRRRAWVAAGISGALLLTLGVLTLTRGLSIMSLFTPSLPNFHQITFQRGLVSSARFAPDGETIIYSAAWQGRPFELFLTRAGESRDGTAESRPLGVTDGRILSVSRSSELAFIVGFQRIVFGLGMLSRSPLSGVAPRQVLKDVREADWITGTPDLAVVRRDGGVDVLEFPIGRKVHQSTGLWSMRVSPDGTRAAMFDGLPGNPSGDVVVVERSGRRTVLSTKWPFVYGLAWSPGGDEVWFSGGRGGQGGFSLYAVSLSGVERPLLRAPNLLHLQDVSPAGRVLLTSVTGGDELWCLPPGEREERDLSWLDGPWVQSISADGQRVLFSEERAGGGQKSIVYLRNTDGSAAVRLAEGRTEGLSPDGRWALVVPMAPSENPTWTIVPTGAGSARSLPPGGFLRISTADWLADSQHIAFTAVKPNERQRIYVQDVREGPPRAISPEGFGLPMNASTPDGRFVLATSDSGPGLSLVPVNGGEIKPLLPRFAGAPLQWSADGRFVFVRRGNFPVEIDRIEIATGRRERWQTLQPHDPAGIDRIFPIVLTPDGKSYCYTATRNLSELFVVDGVK